jgi:hypothetical protein
MKDPGIAGVGFGAEGRRSKALGSGARQPRSGNAARWQVPLVIKDRWCSCRSNQAAWT